METGCANFRQIRHYRRPSASGHSAAVLAVGRLSSGIAELKTQISPEEDPEAIETKYYRMPTAVADDLAKELPMLVSPDTWKSDAQPMASARFGNFGHGIKRWCGPAEPKK